MTRSNSFSSASTRSPPSSPTSASSYSQQYTFIPFSSSESIRQQRDRRRSAPPNPVGSSLPFHQSPSPSSSASSSSASSTSSCRPAGRTSINLCHFSTTSSSSYSNQSAPLSPTTLLHLARARTRTSRRLILLFIASFGLLVAGNVYIGGIVTLEDLNEAIRYFRDDSYRFQQLPHVANSLLYTVGTLLLFSFLGLAAFTYPSVHLTALPFHLLIGTALSKLVPELAVWCGCCYVLLGIVLPYGARILAKIESAVHYWNTCRQNRVMSAPPAIDMATSKMTIFPKASSEVKKPLLPTSNTSDFVGSSSSAAKDAEEVGLLPSISTTTPGATGMDETRFSFWRARFSWLTELRQGMWTLATQLYWYLKSALIFLSGREQKQPMLALGQSSLSATSSPPPSPLSTTATAPSPSTTFSSARCHRLAIALSLWLWFVWTLWHNNEPRTSGLHPQAARQSFRMNYPEPICSGWELEGYHGRLSSFDDYWTDYRALHQRILASSSSLATLSASSLSSSLRKEQEFQQRETRFLIFRPGEHDNLGQRLQGLVSAVVMAMVTRRAIVVDWSLVESSEIPLDALFLTPDGIDWHFNSTSFSTIRNSALYQERDHVWLPYCRDCTLRNPLSPSSPWSRLLCSPSLGLDRHHPVIEVSSAHWFFPVIQHNVFWRGEMCTMFPGGGQDAFERLARIVLRPSPAVQGLVEGVLAKVPKDSTLIGLQIEINPATSPSSSSPLAQLALIMDVQNNTHVVEEAFLQCAKHVIDEEERTISRRGDSSADITPDLTKLTAEPTPQTQKKKQGQRVHYFLSTDSLKTRHYLQSILGDKLLVLDGAYDTLELSAPQTSAKPFIWREALFSRRGVDSSAEPRYGQRPSVPHALGDNNVHDSSNNRNQILSPRGVDSFPSSPSTTTTASLSSTIRAAQAAVAEMLILSKAKRIVSSPYSSQGATAHALANLAPDLVTSSLQCVRRKSTQPCFQYWFAFARSGAACSIRATEEMSEDYNCWL